MSDIDRLERDNKNNLLVCSALVDKEFNERPLSADENPFEVLFGMFTAHAYTIEEVQHSACAADLTRLTHAQLTDCYNVVHFVVGNL